MPFSGQSEISSSDSLERRRIAFCITDLDPGGAEKALFQIVTRLDRRHWEPRVYCLGPEAELAPKLRDQGIVTLCYGAKSWRSLGVFPWLISELELFRPSLLQCFLFHANLVGRITGRAAGVPVILAGHRVAEREKQWHLWLERLTKRCVDHHVCVSQGVADHLVRHARIPPAALTVISNGVEIPPPAEFPVNLQAEFGFSPLSPVILAVGRLHPQKDFLTLLEAFARVRERRPEVRLLIVGEGPQRADLEARAWQLGLGDTVQFAGYRADVSELMRQASVLAVTSRWEGMSNVILEALAVGLPVVATPVEGVAELARSRLAPVVVSQVGATGFSESLLSVLAASNSTSRTTVSAEALEEHGLTWNSVAARYDDLYVQLVK
ncbi:glycosyltransferase [Planctomicrobium piriforme]|uniref:Glycosyltransferase involved in cell wall bisynthesis n=1 Tax=Planctomicrobium piriforme TaxID=1576369 RepID=A0A1I3QBK7_9PLAN|nr:glycosyltransferase [Planctomicrobium piriforme]SFJ31674.1 Glycosyltransferase involved in cell wall bisynthesis [Planctomicrobium piriforme]